MGTCRVARHAAEWDAFVAPLDDANENWAALGQVSHLSFGDDSPELARGLQRQPAEITVYYAELGQTRRCSPNFKALKAHSDFATLSAPRRKIVDNELRDFRPCGAELPAYKKARFMQVQ